MADVEIKFERENLDGVVAVGTYVIDAMKRFGVKTEGSCVQAEKQHFCVVKVTHGWKKLSPMTTEESEYFKIHGHKEHERLACQAVIEKAGEVAVMTKEKKEEQKDEEKDKNEEYRKAFEEMPLEAKIANLVRLEAIALGETFSFIFDSPFKLVDKIGDVMAEFGVKLENEAKAARRPKEHSKEKAAKDSESKNDDGKSQSEPSEDQGS